MDSKKNAILTIGILFLLISCKPTPTDKQQNESPVSKHYVSIDGLWRVTPETALKSTRGTLEPVIRVSGDASGELSVRGCFLWNGRFYDDWDLKSIQFTDSTRQFTMNYDDSGSYEGIVSTENDMIRGIACWDEKDTTDRDTIDFIRNEDAGIANILIPYPTCPDGSIEYTYHIPQERNDQLQPASIFQHVKDTMAFHHLMERIIRQEFGRLESFLIIKDQELVLEEYFFGYSSAQLHYINSCTKSITSLLLGIALERHNQLDVNQPLFNFFSKYDALRTPEKERITLEHLLSMTAGIQEGDGFQGAGPVAFIEYLLSLPLDASPGERFKYSGECTNLLGGIIYTLENVQADEFANAVLFSKLGISAVEWERENGVVPCDAGLYMYPRDMAKIGLLVLNNGSWQGEKIVSKEWIDISTKPHVAESEFFDYGYHWWYRSKQNTPWWENPVQGGKTEHDMVLALGHGGQFIMIVRSLNMAIVVTSSDNNESNGKWLAKVPMVIEQVVPLFE